MRAASLCVLLIAFAVADTQVYSAEPCRGIWAASGKLPHVGDAYTSDAISSPDKESVLTLSEEAIEYRHRSGAPVRLQVPINTALMEIVWAANSGAFAINVSDGDNNGPWQTYLFKGDSGKNAPASIAIEDEVRSSSFAGCARNAVANVATVAWSEDGQEASVVAEAPSNADCRSPKQLSGYRVSMATGKIVERVASDSLTQKWDKQIGCRLQR